MENYIQKINYDINTYDSTYNHQFKPYNNTQWFNFSYINNALAPTGKNLFEEPVSSADIKYFTTNDVLDVYSYDFVIQENEDLNVIASYYNNQDNIQEKNNSEEINIASSSQFRKLESDWGQTDDPIENLFV